MSQPASHDPYSVTDSTAIDPPTSLFGKLRFLGPGFILSASIVGSGELIATTILGAEAGFVLLWFVIFSCLVKVALQLEFGKHAISSGESTMASLNALPGPRLGRANWSIWTWLLLMVIKMLQLGGIVGGVILAVGQLMPSLVTHRMGLWVTTYAITASVSLLVFGGYYKLLERTSLVMIAAFTAFTLFSLIALQSTEMAITTAEVASGLAFRLPKSTVLLAIGAFGITGVGGDEIMAYNYWLIEKGYASFVGPKPQGDDHDDWYRRAHGWIRIMYLDAILAMVAYTAVTVMFFLLGSAILHRNGIVPEKSELIRSLGTLYTQSLGPWAKNVFLIGAVVVLYSTLFAALAAWTRMFADAFGRIGWYSFENQRSRKFAIAAIAWLFPIIWATTYLVVESPGWMVIVGGLSTTVILLIVVFAAIYFRYFRLDPKLKPGKIYDAALWLSVIAILFVASIGLRDVYQKMFPPRQQAAVAKTMTVHHTFQDLSKPDLRKIRKRFLRVRTIVLMAVHRLGKGSSSMATSSTRFDVTFLVILDGD